MVEEPILTPRQQNIVDIVSLDSSQGASTRSKKNANTVHIEMVFNEEDEPNDQMIVARPNRIQRARGKAIEKIESDSDDEEIEIQPKWRSLKREIANLQVSNDKEWKSSTRRRKLVPKTRSPDR